MPTLIETQPLEMVSTMQQTFLERIPASVFKPQTPNPKTAQSTEGSLQRVSATQSHVPLLLPPHQACISGSPLLRPTTPRGAVLGDPCTARARREGEAGRLVGVAWEGAHEGPRHLGTDQKEGAAVGSNCMWYMCLVYIVYTGSGECVFWVTNRF